MLTAQARWLRTFSSDSEEGDRKINDPDADEFFEHVVDNHPSRRRRAIFESFRRWTPCS